MGFVGYFERTTSGRSSGQTIALWGKLSWEILVPSCSDDSTQILLNLTRFLMLSTESNLEGFVHGVIKA